MAHRPRTVPAIAVVAEFQDWNARKKFGSKGDRYRFSGIVSFAPLVRAAECSVRSSPLGAGEGSAAELAAM
ncbi:hypothetical protein [Paenibacillus sp. JCM 10914]|uniref:hypothetical protein n=1 Tax=Paenibacillus sp. JCM 10914 TaxID=1236974 RepID=UPI0003CC5415|nr:hypothetical protein [Paenibacillus sp. JCM 10914]GAE04089.1 hypothetical protein JCM10914_114 [Paenibacillus sp. JCM 10914]